METQHLISKGITAGVLGLLLITCNAAFAATYYVATNGNDAHAGTMAAPWATLYHASQQVQPGDVVKVIKGVYPQNAFVIGSQGTSIRPILFEAEGGPVTFDGSAIFTNWQHEGGERYSAIVPPDVPLETIVVWSNGQRLLGPWYEPLGDEWSAVKPTTGTLKRGQSLLEGGRLYVRLFDGGNPNNSQMRVSKGVCILLANARHTIFRRIGVAWGLVGYKLEAGSSHNRIEDADLHHLGAQAIQENAAGDTSVHCQSNMFQRLTIHHIALTKFEHGIYTGGLRTRVLDCQFYRISGAPIHAYGGPVQGEFDGNKITSPAPAYQPTDFNTDPPTAPTLFYHAMVIEGAGGHRVTNNLIVGRFDVGILVNSGSSHASWFWNNTLVLTDGKGFIFAPGGAGHQVVNNIIQTSGWYMEGEAPAVADYNGYFGGQGWIWGSQVACPPSAATAYATLADVQALGKEAHGLVADPLFVNPATGDYGLSAASLFLNLGWTFGAPDVDLIGVPRPQGSGVDLGAFERPVP